MDDNFTDNSLAGFRTLRASYFKEPGADPSLAERGLSTRDLDLLAQDVLDDKLPQVSWVVATAAGSEHPGPSSPAQGADYIARVLEALTGNPEVWARTVLFVNFDENDGFFDHVPPPAAPSYSVWDQDEKQRELAGASTIDTLGEYHEFVPVDVPPENAAPLHRPYGLGPRVPMYVVSPWSKGGWVNSEVFDHTSVIRFLEQRFGVHRHWEPQAFRVRGGDDCEEFLSLRSSANWYDFTVRVVELDAFSRRFAGRLETGKHSLSDPEMGGRARGEHA